MFMARSVFIRMMQEKMTEETLEEIRQLSRLPKAVAIGEIGLDYYWHKEEHEHEIQKKMFLAQMEIAREEKLPFMVHSRDAAKDTLDLVKGCMKGGMYGGITIVFLMEKKWQENIWTWDCIWESVVLSHLKMRRN